MKKKGLVVFVFPKEGTDTGNRYGGFAAKLQKAGALPDHDILTVALENLAFCVEESGEAEVIDTVSGTDIGQASFVYLKSWEVMTEEAAALATYLHHKGVPFIDSLPLGMGVSKLVTAFRMWGNGLRVPNTLYVRRSDRLLPFIRDKYAGKLGDTFIAKDINGAKGKDNYLLTSEELAQVVDAHPDKQFICQRFIPNDGDYRLGVYIDAVRFVIKRVGSGGSHLNNTSAGGKAEYIPTDKMPGHLMDIALAAAQAAELQVAGVDIIVDKDTAQPYILEVNQGSQIVSGAFVEENITAFAAAINQAVPGRYPRRTKKPLKTIGRRTVASLPELGVLSAIAKVDTGAYSSTLHAENIHIEENASGEKELVFDIRPTEKLQSVDGKSHTIRTKEFSQQKVRSSNGHVQTRYSIRTKISIKGMAYPAVLTLSDRSQMGYPVLLGRRIVRSRFVVNVELNEDNVLKWNF